MGFSGPRGTERRTVPGWALVVVCVASALGLYRADAALGDPPAPPTLTLPAAATVEPQSARGSVVAFAVSAVDWKEREVDVRCSPASGSAFPLGRTRISCRATDRRHETTQGSFPLLVEHLYRPGEGAKVRAGRRLRLAWYPVAGARLYNVQLWKSAGTGWRKVLTAWPSRPGYRLGRSWRFDGRRHRLARGAAYAWFAWPLLDAGYGPLLGRNLFSVRRS